MKTNRSNLQIIKFKPQIVLSVGFGCAYFNHFGQMLDQVFSKWRHTQAFDYIVKGSRKKNEEEKNGIFHNRLAC